MPSIVRVLPVPVWPYAKNSTFVRSSANDWTRSGTMASVTSCCVASIPKTRRGYSYRASPLLKRYCVSIVTLVSSHVSKCLVRTVPSSACPPSEARGRIRTYTFGLCNPALSRGGSVGTASAFVDFLRAATALAPPRESLAVVPTLASSLAAAIRPLPCFPLGESDFHG